jgi:hypothetical protein
VTFVADESGVETSRPREIYEINMAPVAISPVTFKLYVASGKYDILYGGNVYKAYPVNRSDQEIATLITDTHFQFSLPLVHDLPRRWVRNGIPPDVVSITCRRIQLTSGEADVIWSGVVTSMSITGHTANFQVQSRMQRQMKRRLPVYVVSKNCQHVLYGPNCRANPVIHTFVYTVAYVSGRDVQLNYVPSLGDQTRFLEGDFTHDLTGQKRTIKIQDAQDYNNQVHIQLQSMIPELKVGDSVTLREGCNHGAIQCDVKFDNIGNFGGFPDLPPSNAFVMNIKTGS